MKFLKITIFSFLVIFGVITTWQHSSQTNSTDPICIAMDELTNEEQFDNLIDFILKNDKTNNPIHIMNRTIDKETGETLLQRAAELGIFDTVMKLLRLKVDINAKDFEGFTALHYAVLNTTCPQAFDITVALVERKADLFIQNNDKYSAVDIALSYEDVNPLIKGYIISLLPSQFQLPSGEIINAFASIS